MLTPISDKEKVLIVKNVLQACKDIKKLNKRGYNFLYLASGFIAHFNLYGFINYYSENNLIEDILRNQLSNMWLNFHPGEQNYEYYMSKKQVYQDILDGLLMGVAR